MKIFTLIKEITLYFTHRYGFISAFDQFSKYFRITALNYYLRTKGFYNGS